MKGSFNLEEHSQSSQCHIYIYIVTLWDMLMHMEKDMKPKNRADLFPILGGILFSLLDELIETEMRDDEG